ncbi:H-2 class II histocompatibility antigen, E-D beta chain-like [Electrophorus electricus]|uniref:H-2 class II histocompatibility antigen, E-D beta chain-like n=1 Tax=Electrophorus electricus TaxID=8005 RepID=UPI0015D0AA34|nr:H-2 class II histocompatibility antigen, E-D beta chain-like [Electrophorus electricus]
MFFNLQLLLVITAVLGTDGYYHYVIAECLSSSSALTDVVLIATFYFNKDPVLRFNSTVGEYVGFTELGVKNAEIWNKGPEVQQARAQLEGYCKNNLRIDYSAVLDKAVKPKVQLKSELQSDGSRPALLMCSAYDFYPPVIKISWLRDGQKVTSAVTSTEEMPEGDWFYQIHSQLDYIPKSGERISCVVEHASFQQPMVYDWDPTLPESERNKVAIGASGLVLGIILSAAGFIYYKKKSTGRILVPS